MTARRTLLLTALLALGACDVQAPVVGPMGVNRCTSDAQCLDGVCDLATHRCVADARTEVFFRIVPPSSRGGNAIATLTAPRTIHAGQSVDLTLRAWRTVYGTVVAPREGDPMSTPTPVPATVLFSPADAPGVVPTLEAVSQTAALSPVGNDAVPHTWALALSDGTFDVVVRPTLAFRASVPPRFEPRFDVRSGSPYQRFDIVYPATYARWSGVVLGRDGTPVSGLTVRAVDPLRNGLDVSTTVSTAANTGAWSIAMAPGAPQEWSLRVSAEVNAHAGLVFEVKRAACARLDANESEAARIANQAIKVDESYAEAYIAKGVIAQRRHRLKQARSAYRRYLLLAPNGKHASEIRHVLENMK